MNPFREKATKAREYSDRLNRPTTHEQAMAASFPLGAGRGGRQRGGVSKRIDASVTRAGQAVAASKRARHLEAQADAFDRGEIDTQGRSWSPEQEARAEKRQKASDSRQERIQAAKDAVTGKERWEVLGSVWAASNGIFRGGALNLVMFEHRDVVFVAMLDGKPVPQDVLLESLALTQPDVVARLRRDGTTVSFDDIQKELFLGVSDAEA